MAKVKGKKTRGRSPRHRGASTAVRGRANFHRSAPSPAHRPEYFPTSLAQDDSDWKESEWENRDTNMDMGLCLAGQSRCEIEAETDTDDPEVVIQVCRQTNDSTQ